LVQNGIQSNGSFTGLTVTNNQLTLTTTNGDHGVNTLDTRLHGLIDRLTGDDTGSLDLDSLTLDVLQGTFTVNGVTKGIDNTTEETLADRDIDNGTGSLDNVTLLDESVVTKDDNTDIVGLQVQGLTLFPVFFS
jgi:hypothetical protein